MKIYGPGIFDTIENLKVFSMVNINRHGLTKGYSDYFFEWNQEPNKQLLNSLFFEIDKFLPKNFDVYYKIITKDSSLAKKRLELAQMMIYSQLPGF